MSCYSTDEMTVIPAISQAQNTTSNTGISKADIDLIIGGVLISLPIIFYITMCCVGSICCGGNYRQNSYTSRVEPRLRTSRTNQRGAEYNATSATRPPQHLSIPRSDIPPRRTSTVAKVSHDAQDNIKGSVIQQHLQWQESMLQDWPETSV